MAFSAPLVTHTFVNADSTAASGSIEWTLGARMQNGTQSIVPSSITSNLDANGLLSQLITSNTDSGTVPTAPGNTQWRVDMRILGSSIETYFVVVPPIQTETNGSIVSGALNVVQLSSLTAAEFMVGQSAICAGKIPSDATVLSVNLTTNTVTISANGTAGTALSVTLGTTIDLGQLLPNQQQL